MAIDPENRRSGRRFFLAGQSQDARIARGANDPEAPRLWRLYHLGAVTKENLRNLCRPESGNRFQQLQLVQTSNSFRISMITKRGVPYEFSARVAFPRPQIGMKSAERLRGEPPLSSI